MPASTPNLAMPYPLGTDRVADGDDQIKALAERIEARLPWGKVAYSQSLVMSGAASAETAIPGWDVTFTPVTGRRYLFTAQCEIVQTVAGDVFIVKLNTEPGAVQIQRAVGAIAGAGAAATRVLSWTNNASLTAASTRFTGTFIRASGSGTAQCGGQTAVPSLLLVQDIGLL